jgi:photosystem II stability/assembly factor-like uncharacterized protein
MHSGLNSRNGLITAVAVLFLFLATVSWAGQWSVLGPDGGDARSLSYDPQDPDHLFLGTSTGELFSSKDGGRSWARFAHLGTGDDYVLDHIAIDPQNPKNIFAAAWSVDNQQSGDLFRSRDGGKTWEPLLGMHGKSIRALAMAASDSRVLVAGALDGVYRSLDGGDSWQRISASHQSEIKNIESIAVDPKDPNIAYAGTWHLAWKTDDGGANWRQIDKGMITDSDVFSIIVDSSNPSVVFASACSGIYRSGNAGELFGKIQGIPFSARRTRVLKQDPSSPDTVYAGTTEGLWKTADSGKTWKHVTGSEIVVNDVLIDPRNSQRVLLATDRGGVLSSDNGAGSFVASNHGYSHRYVTAILGDKSDPNTLFVGVLNDREWGGVFASRDGGQHWSQKSEGLEGRDVFTLQQASDGALIAGTNRGIFLLGPTASTWRPINSVINEKTTFHTVKKGTKRVSVARKAVTRAVLGARIDDLQVVPGRWLAATSGGLFISTNGGSSWSGGPVLGKQDLISVQARGDLLVVATRIAVMLSTDSGAEWKQATLPSYLTIRGLTLTPDGTVLVAAREGAYRSSDSGLTWEHVLDGLPDKNISSISYDERSKLLLATSTATGVVFESENGGHSWHRGPDAGYTLRHIGVVHGRFVAATPFDGVIAQPENEAQSAAAGSGELN